jgi:hypothetical protein
MTELLRENGVLSKRHVIRQSRLNGIRRQASFDESIAPPCPVDAEPVSLANPRGLFKGALARRRTVRRSHSLDFTDDVLFRHDQVCLTDWG